MAKVKFQNVTKAFGPNTVVKELNLEVRDKEFLVLVGPSGCGKTTTLRMVAGLEEPTRGDIFIGEERVNGVAPRDRDIAMVFQNYALYPHMNVYDNMAFGLRMRKVPPSEVDRRVRSTAEMLGIASLLNRQPRELSGGQRQRVALGRAIVRKPRVFLMDEPLSNLDAKLRVEMRAELLKLHRQLQTTIIYVTHDQTEAMTMGNRIAVIKDGVLQQIAPPQEVYDRPRNLSVAGFIGSPSMNFVKCRAVTGGDGAVYLTDGDSFRFKAPGEKASTLKDKKLILGIRPEALKSLNGNEVTEGSFTATVDLVETLGAELLLYLSLGKSSLVARLPADAQYRVGQKVRAGFDPSKVRIFDENTGEALPF